MLKLTSFNQQILVSKTLRLTLLNKNYKTLLHNRKNLFLFSSDKKYQKFRQRLKSGQYYQVLGYTSQTIPSKLTDNEIKRQYLGMIKKYHSDNVTDPQQKLQNQQITKCIISAYEKLNKQRTKAKINAPTYEDVYKLQDEVAMKLYGKKFNEVKYQIFQQDNLNKKKQFMQELQRVKKQSKHYQYQQKHEKKSPYRRNDNYQQTYTTNSSSSSTKQKQISLSQKLITGSFISLLVFGLLYQINNRQRRNIQCQQLNRTKLTLSEQKKKQIQKRSIQLYNKKLNDLIQSFTQQQPPCLKLSNQKDPDQLQQLIQYTISSDIHLYQIPAELLSSKNMLQKMNKVKRIQQITQFKQKFYPFELTRLKPNSTITLSLQAQRCLQNIYIKVKDVAEQIQQKGKYTPPKIFFKFYGYLMFQIRQKPLSLLNYRDTEYISLFDLFFDYYSPIPLKRHQYNEYLVGFYNNTDQRMFGQVHLNHRKIPEKYITKDDKVVVMKQTLSDKQDKYIEIWSGFYQKYMKMWDRKYPGRISTYLFNQ